MEAGDRCRHDLDLALVRLGEHDSVAGRKRMVIAIRPYLGRGVACDEECVALPGDAEGLGGMDVRQQMTVLAAARLTLRSSTGPSTSSASAATSAGKANGGDAVSSVIGRGRRR
jgi:hypothetical protein